MKMTTLKRPWRGWWTTALGYAVMATGLLATSNLVAMPHVSTLGGGWGHGYVDGNTASSAQFYTPIGLAMDSSGNLYVADRDNNAIRWLDLDFGQTFTFATNSINHPIGVAVDGLDNVFDCADA